MWAERQLYSSHYYPGGKVKIAKGLTKLYFFYSLLKFVIIADTIQNMSYEITQINLLKKE